MRLRLTVLFLAFSCSSILAQETFPVNGVSSSFEPIFAFTNAHLIISPEKEIQKGILLIQGNKIITADAKIYTEEEPEKLLAISRATFHINKLPKGVNINDWRSNL